MADQARGVSHKDTDEMSHSAYIKPDPVNIPPSPACIDDLPFCGVWKRENETKVPYNPLTGRRAKANDASTFATRAQAERALASGKYDGLCILIDESLGITGGDLDHVVPQEHAFDESQIPTDVRRLIRIANTWTCWSPSGTGIRFIFGASLGRRYMTRNKANRICAAEAYSRLRFMTVTLDQRITGTQATFNTDVDDLEAWHEALRFPLRDIEQPPRPQPTYSGGSRSNALIVETASQVNGAKFRRLHEGDISGYPESQTDKGFSSEADGAYVLTLCGYSGDDAQVADIWRSESRLYRTKLDRQDYVGRTIESARRKQSWWFDWESNGRFASQPPKTHLGSTGPGQSADPPTADPPTAATGATCDQQLKVALETIAIQAAKLKAAEGTIATLRERVRRGDERWAVARNTKLGAARLTAAVLPSLFQDERPKDPNSTTGYRVPLDRLADRTGLAPETCSKHLTQLATYRTADGTPVLHAETRDIPRQVNQATGEIVEPHKEVWIGPGPIQQDAFGHVLATLEPAEAPKHGGAPDRNACPDHPFAGVIRRTKTTRKVTRECAHCNTILNATIVPIGTPTAEFIPASAPIQQDAFGHESGNPGQAPPMPQHAASTSSHTPDKNQSSNMRHSPLPSEEHPSGSWNGRDGVAGDDAWTGAGWRAA